MVLVIQAWIDQLLINPTFSDLADKLAIGENCSSLRDYGVFTASCHPEPLIRKTIRKFPLPLGVEFINCFKGACVIGKRA